MFLVFILDGPHIILVVVRHRYSQSSFKLSTRQVSQTVLRAEVMSFSTCALSFKQVLVCRNVNTELCQPQLYRPLTEKYVRRRSVKLADRGDPRQVVPVLAYHASPGSPNDPFTLASSPVQCIHAECAPRLDCYSVLVSWQATGLGFHCMYTLSSFEVSANEPEIVMENVVYTRLRKP